MVRKKAELDETSDPEKRNKKSSMNGMSTDCGRI